MLNTVKKHVHLFDNKAVPGRIKNGRINNSRRNLNCYFVGGTTIVGEQKPMTELEPVSDNQDESGLLKFIDELALDGNQKIIECLWPINVDKCDLHRPYLQAVSDVDAQQPMAELEPLFSLFPANK